MQACPKVCPMFVSTGEDMTFCDRMPRSRSDVESYADLTDRTLDLMDAAHAFSSDMPWREACYPISVLLGG